MNQTFDPRILHVSSLLLKSSFQALDCIQRLLISQTSMCPQVPQTTGYPMFNTAVNRYQTETNYSQGDMSNGMSPNFSSDSLENINYPHLSLSRTASFDSEEHTGLMRRSKKIHKPDPSTSLKPKNMEENLNNNLTNPKRQRWHEEEDTQLLALFAKHGPKWTILAASMHGRTAKQVRDRYINILRPDLKRDQWTEEEEKLFLDLYAKYGNRWCKIAEHLPGRSENQVKNKFNCMRKKEECVKINSNESSDETDGTEKRDSELKVEYQCGFAQVAAV